MAVDLCRENSSRGFLNMSPRISFSHDLNQSEIIPIEPLNSSSLLDYDYDFDFCVSKRSCDQDSSLADELFEDGVLLPIQIKAKPTPMSSNNATSSPSSPVAPAAVLSGDETEEAKETEEKQGSSSSSKLFWKFKRSKSFNCGSGSGSLSNKKRFFWSLPLLSRSKSTGSTPTDKGSLNSKNEAAYHHDNHNHNRNRNHNHNHNHDDFNGGLKQYIQKNSNSNSPHHHHHRRPPLKKNYGVVQVNPVLNVPTEKLLGIFSHGKDKCSEKK